LDTLIFAMTEGAFFGKPRVSGGVE
jgi:hypothetical protein